MTREEMIALLETRVGLISDTLYEGMSRALTNSERRVGDLVRAGHLHLRSLTVRGDLKQHLESSELRGWTVGGESRLMGQLLLFDPVHGLHVRVLKERRATYPGGVPTAGHNIARRAFWQQPPLFGPVPIAEPDEHRLLMLWDLQDASRIEEGFTLRLVHTLEAGRYGQPVACDLSLNIGPGGSLQSRLRFEGADEDVDFFEVEVNEQDDELGG